MPLKTLGPIGPRAVGERLKRHPKVFCWSCDEDPLKWDKKFTQHPVCYYGSNEPTLTSQFEWSVNTFNSNPGSYIKRTSTSSIKFILTTIFRRGGVGNGHKFVDVISYELIWPLYLFIFMYFKFRDLNFLILVLRIPPPSDPRDGSQ